MKNIKFHSTTSDTRAASQIFNNSLLSKTPNNYLSHQIQQSENKQTQFLKIKNQQLNQRLSRMSDHVKDLQANKIKILGLNSNYIKILNQYYKDSDKKSQNQCLNSSTPSNSKQSTKVLTQLERQHRNLVKHCLVMEDQLKNYQEQMGKYNQLKSQLRATNHNNITELIQEVKELSNENKQLKKQNNKIGYLLEKCKIQNQKLKNEKEHQSQSAEMSGFQVQKMLSLINTVKQQSKDKSDNYEAKIYQLELKVQKLELQLRKDQQSFWKNSQLRKKLQIQQVQHIHEKKKLHNDLSELLQAKKRSQSSQTALINHSKQFLNLKRNSKPKLQINNSFLH